VTKANCDKLGCVGFLASGRTVALVLDVAAFAEDCTRADIIVTPRFAPLGCATNIVIDREKLKQTGALTLAFAKDGVVQMHAARAADEDRPWSSAPKRGWGRSAPPVAAAKEGQNQDTGQEPGEDADASPLE
jgi:competence protein ComEC